MRPLLLSLCALVAAGPAVGQPPPAAKAAEKPAGAERFRLENGLTVIVRPVRGADRAALVVLFNVGEHQDPEGKSGLAHMVEHVYVTAAAGAAKARTADAYMTRYRGECNAQTGDAYTVVAAVFPRERLGEELRDAAARMGDLRVEPSDLEREVPRVVDEVENMFGRIPALGALNHARELVRPAPRGGRGGGRLEHVKALRADDVRDHWKKYYKPRNAVLVLAGAVDAKEARTAVADLFGKLPAGEAAPAPAAPGKARLGEVAEVAARPAGPGGEPAACLAYLAPAPGSDRYPAFLVLLARLWAATERDEAVQVMYPLLEDPAVVRLTATPKDGETAKQVVARLEGVVAKAVGPALRKGEASAAASAVGLFLGTADLPEDALAENPYAVALALGRREQLGVDGARLKAALAALTEADLRAAAKEVFGPDRHAAAVITVREK